MRLINVETLEMEEFFGDAIPDYAILSHTWAEQEVSFDAWQQPDKAVAMKGYSKILGACKFAAQMDEGIAYVWADTACIDKRSSADLSEAINSMFRWYAGSRVCLVHLADVDAPAGPVAVAAEDRPRNDVITRLRGVAADGAEPAALLGDLKRQVRASRFSRPRLNADADAGASTALSEELRRQFRTSRWFTRGWTLQELLAPRRVLFLSRNWQLLGNVPSLVDDVEAATGIPGRFLLKDLGLQAASIAQRMAWAAGRETTRIEDTAYCLMGLFGISMPLLYGEGAWAFRRLQAEIIKESYDHSIFAWQGGADQKPEAETEGSGHTEGLGHAEALEALEEPSGDLRYPILAPSPHCFRGHSRIIQAWDHTERSHYTLTNSGLRITLPVLRTITPGLILAVLNCRSSSGSAKSRVGLVLYSTSGDRYTRLAGIPVKLASVAGVLPAARRKMYVTSPDSLDMGDMSNWAAFAMLWSPAATPLEASAEAPASAFLAFEGGAYQPPPRYLEPKLGWKRLLCPWTRPGLMELCATGSSTYAVVLEFTDPETDKKLCVVIGCRPRDVDDGNDNEGTGDDNQRRWFACMLQRSPRPDETFDNVFKLAEGAGEADPMRPGSKAGSRPYAEIQFPQWGTKMQWVPAGCPMIIVRTDMILAKARAGAGEGLG